MGVYLIGGFIYQRLVVGAKGWEQLPNYAFWQDFGNLQAVSEHSKFNKTVPVQSVFWRKERMNETVSNSGFFESLWRQNVRSQFCACLHCPSLCAVFQIRAQQNGIDRIVQFHSSCDVVCFRTVNYSLCFKHRKKEIKKEQFWIFCLVSNRKRKKTGFVIKVDNFSSAALCVCVCVCVRALFCFCHS